MPNEPVNTPDITGGEPGKSELDILNDVDNEPAEDVADITEDKDDAGDKEDEESDDEETDDESSDDDEEDSDDESDDEESDDDSDEDEELPEGSLFQQLKATHPEVLKKFPELRATLFRESQYTELFPTVEEAKEIKERNEVFTQLEGDILAGNPKELLISIEKTDKEALNQFVHNFLPAILEQSKDLYSEVLQIPIKRAIQSAYVNAKKSGNKNLQNAALHLDNFFFEGDGIAKDPDTAVRPKETKKSPEVERLEKERNEHAERLKSEFNNSVIEVLNTRLDKTISEAIKSYDFDGYKRKNVVNDIKNEINRLLAADNRYQASIKSLYKQAESAKFTSDWKPRITSAFLARANAVLNIAKKKVIAEATGRPAGKTIKKRIPTSNASGKFGTGQIDVKKIDRSKTTDADILSDDPSRIKYRN